MLILLLLDIFDFLVSITVVPAFAGINQVFVTLTEFTFSLAWVSDIIVPAIKIFSYILGSPLLFSAILTLSATLAVLEISASFIWWIIYKIPIINIKR